MESVIGAIAERLSQGGTIEAADAHAILDTPDLIAVGALADDVRRRMHGTRTTFQRVLEVHCDGVPASLPDALAAGEVRLVGRPASAEAAIASVRAASALVGAIPLSGFALADLQALAGGGTDALEQLCATLRGAGLQMVAETSIDAVNDARAAIAAARRAGLLVTTLAVRALPADRGVSLVVLARTLQDSLGGFRALAPLPRTTSTSPTTGYDDVKLVAVARLLATNIPSIQVDWALYGPKLAQVALTAGADDVDGVSAVETGMLGPRRSAMAEIRGNIEAAALVPVERNARWEAVGG
jgi:aminodeoxyfutalosine synthase